MNSLRYPMKAPVARNGRDGSGCDQFREVAVFVELVTQVPKCGDGSYAKDHGGGHAGDQVRGLVLRVAARRGTPLLLRLLRRLDGQVLTVLALLELALPVLGPFAGGGLDQEAGPDASAVHAGGAQVSEHGRQWVGLALGQGLVGVETEG